MTNKFYPLTRDEVISLATQVFRTWDLTRWWLHKPSPAFNGSTPMALLATGELQPVYDYLLMAKERSESDVVTMRPVAKEPLFRYCR